MTLTEYIDVLRDIRQEHGGDIPVEDENGELVSAPEFNDDEYPCVVVCGTA